MEHKKKKIAGIIFIVIVITASAAYIFSSATARSSLKNGTAVALNAWEDVFGERNGLFSSEIDIQGATSGLMLDDDANFAPIPAQTPDHNVTTTKKQVVKSISPDSEQKFLIPVTAPDDGSVSSSVEDADVLPVIVPSSTTVSLPSCTPSLVTRSSSRKVLLNEIAWMGSVPTSEETATKASDREWMELKNNVASDVDLSGWQLLDASGNIKIVFAVGDHLAPGNFYLLERGADAVPNIAADVVYAGGLSNSGEALFLFDSNCALSDFVDASSGWPGGDNTTKQTLERNADGVGWHTSVPAGGTPKAENSVPIAPIAGNSSGGGSGSSVPPVSTPRDTATTTAATTTTTATSSDETPEDPVTTASTTCATHIVIAVVQTGGASSTNDLVKLFNPGTSAVDISGWKLRKKTSTGSDGSLRELPDGSTVSAGGYFVWANSANGFSASVSADVSSTETLAGDNSAALIDASSTIVDAVAWGDGTDQYVEGDPYPTNPAPGQVLERKFLNGAIVDTDDNANDFTLQ